MGKDYTLFAKQPGIVVYQASKYIRKVGLQQLHTWRSVFVQGHALHGVLRLPFGTSAESLQVTCVPCAWMCVVQCMLSTVCATEGCSRSSAALHLFLQNLEVADKPAVSWAPHASCVAVRAS